MREQLSACNNFFCQFVFSLPNPSPFSHFCGLLSVYPPCGLQKIDFPPNLGNLWALVFLSSNWFMFVLVIFLLWLLNLLSSHFAFLGVDDLLFVLKQNNSFCCLVFQCVFRSLCKYFNLTSLLYNRFVFVHIFDANVDLLLWNATFGSSKASTLPSETYESFFFFRGVN